MIIAKAMLSGTGNEWNVQIFISRCPKKTEKSHQIWRRPYTSPQHSKAQQNYPLQKSLGYQNHMIREIVENNKAKGCLSLTKNNKNITSCLFLNLRFQGDNSPDHQLHLLSTTSRKSHLEIPSINCLSVMVSCSEWMSQSGQFLIRDGFLLKK